MGVRTLACWDCGLESRRECGFLPVVRVMCSQVTVCASGRTFVQRSHTECGVSECGGSECGGEDLKTRKTSSTRKVCLSVSLYVSLSVRLYLSISISIYACLPACLYINVHTHTHTHTSIYIYGTEVAQWLRCCVTNRKAAGSIQD